MLLRRHHAVVLLVGSLAGLAACGGGSGSSAESSVPAAVTLPEVVTAPSAPPTTAAPSTTTAAPETTPPTTVAVTEPPTTVPVERFALTGLPVNDINLTLRPALAVKINNHPDARPQAGLNQADIVYEEIVEGITRFFVIFHSQDAAPIGPIRSARTTDINLLAQLNRPLFAWSGGNRGVVNAVGQANAESRAQGQAPGYYRDEERKRKYAIEHTLFIESTQHIWSTTGLNQGLPTPFFTYRADGEEVPGQPAVSLKAKMSGTPVEWVWSTDTKQWIRAEYGSLHLDTTGAPVSAENIVVQFCEYGRSDADPKSPEAITVGSGDVWVFTAGKVIEGRWDRPDPAKPFVLTDTSGNPIKLTPGRTWIELPRAGDTQVDWS